MRSRDLHFGFLGVSGIYLITRCLELKGKRKQTFVEMEDPL